MAPAVVFVTLSATQVAAMCVLIFAAIALAYLLALDEGRARGRREQREQARQHGSDGLRLIRGEEDGE